MRLPMIFAFLALPMLEIALLIKAGQQIGVLGVVALIIATAVGGLAVIRRQGFSLISEMTAAIERGEPPKGPALDDALVVMAGMLLIAPGLITDTLGLLLLVPPLRRIAGLWGVSLLFSGMGSQHGPAAPSGDSTVIDGEFERLDEHDSAPRPPPGQSLPR